MEALKADVCRPVGRIEQINEIMPRIDHSLASKCRSIGVCKDPEVEGHRPDFEGYKGGEIEVQNDEWSWAF